MSPRLQFMVIDSDVIVSDNRCRVNGDFLAGLHGRPKIAVRGSELTEIEVAGMPENLKADSHGICSIAICVPA